MKLIKADKPLKTANETFGKVEISVEVPQYDSVSEFVNACGGEERALAVINGDVSTNAKNVGRAFAREARLEENESKDAGLARVTAETQKRVREFTPETQDRGISAKKAKETMVSLKSALESGKDFSRDELLAMLAQAK